MIRGGAVRIGVRDVDEAVRFYVETLGMKLVEAPGVIDAGEGFHIELVKGGSKGDIALTTKLPMTDAVNILENRGVRVTSGAFEDPDGNRFCLRQG